MVQLCLVVMKLQMCLTFVYTMIACVMILKNEFPVVMNTILCISVNLWMIFEKKGALALMLLKLSTNLSLSWNVENMGLQKINQHIIIKKK